MLKVLSIYINIDDKGSIVSVDISQRSEWDVIERIPGDISLKCEECCNNFSVEVFTSYKPSYSVKKETEVKEDEDGIIKTENGDVLKVHKIEPEIEISTEPRTKKRKLDAETTHPYKRVHCSNCNLKFAETNLDTHKLTCTDKKVFKCSKCDKIWPSNYSLLAHLRSCRSGIPTCSYCDEVFATWRIAQNHMNDVHVKNKPPNYTKTKHSGKTPEDFGRVNWNRVHCPNCNLKFSEKTFESHKLVCTERQIFECKKCKKVWPNNYSLLAHLSSCRPERVGTPTCTYCNKVFSTWQIAQNHMNDIHLKIKTFVCHICSKIVHRQRDLDKHLARHNKVETDPFECDLCGYKVRTFNSIKSHVIMQHMTDFKFLYCNQCDPPKKFICLKRLEGHKKSHSDIKDYPCTECPRVFKTKLSLKVHQFRFHTPDGMNKNFTCEVPGCGFATHTKERYRTHKLVHLDDSERPFKCSYCPKGYTTGKTLRNHEMTHTRERPFACSTCGKTFKASNTLKVHMRLHTGEKPYECSICQQRFSDRGCYRSHIISHEKQLNVTLSKSVKKFMKDYSFPEAFD